MDFHLDRKLKLNVKPKHENLYKWAIVEVDERDRQVGIDQIPWGWRLYFTAKELVLGDHLNLKNYRGDEDNPQQHEVTHRRTIRTKLRPGDPRSDDDWYRQTTYRMFGTDREIKRFELDIHPLASEDEPERCEAGGSVSYTAESDFRNKTEEDVVCFYLFVKPASFNRYAARIATGTADELILSVGLVSGFYSEWSPSISTRDVKVLTRGDEQEIELPAGMTFEAPRLGDVGEVDLYINTSRVQMSKLPSADDEPGEQDETASPPLVRPETVDARPSADPELTAAVQKLGSSAKWIVGLLVLLVIVTVVRG